MSLTPGTLPLVFHNEITPADGPVYILVFVCRELDMRSNRRLRVTLTDGKYASDKSVIVTNKNLEKGYLLKIKHWNITGSRAKLFDVEDFQIEKKNFHVPQSLKDWKYGDAFERPPIVDLQEIIAELEALTVKYNHIMTCSVCAEKFNSGENHAVKLKCKHVICGACASSWLIRMGNQASCPQCREIYKARDIQPVLFDF